MKYILSTLLTLFAIELNAQTIQDVILTMPDDVVVGLTIDQKKELAFNKVKDTVEIDNVLNGEILRVNISDDYVCLQTSEVGTTQIKILPLINDTKILCVVKTVCANTCDSRIQFYTTDWKLLPNQNLLPKRSFEWFVKDDVDKQSNNFLEAMKSIDMNPMIFNLSSKNYTLTVDSDIANYLASDDLEDLIPYLKKKSVIFVWNKISFREKQ